MPNMPEVTAVTVRVVDRATVAVTEAAWSRLVTRMVIPVSTKDPGADQAPVKEKGVTMIFSVAKLSPSKSQDWIL